MAMVVFVVVCWCNGGVVEMWWWCDDGRWWWCGGNRGWMKGVTVMVAAMVDERWDDGTFAPAIQNADVFDDLQLRRKLVRGGEVVTKNEVILE